MKKYMVRTEMEGISGIVCYEQIDPLNSEYEAGRRFLMADLLALLDGLKEGGAEEVVIYDHHGPGRNIKIEQLPVYSRVICGRPPYNNDWCGGLDDSFDGLVLLGFHTKFGTEGGLFNSSYRPEISDMRLNGVSIGEIGMEAALAGDLGVPVIMITGDSSGIIEATSLLPGILGVVVKDALGAWNALCYPLSVTTSLIKQVASQAVMNPPEVAPYYAGDNVSLEIDLQAGLFLDTAVRLYGGSMSGTRTLVLSGSRATEVWSDYIEREIIISREAGKT